MDYVYIAHHGVKGQKWGVRKDDTYTPRKTNRLAKKDAKEFARAKMYYGDGAGTRRKLIGATVKQRSTDPVYKSAFDKHLASQNMADHAAKARSERTRADVKAKTAKTTRGLIRAATGNIAYASAGAIALYTIGRATGANKVVASYLKKGATVASSAAQEAYKKGKRWAQAQHIVRNTVIVD